MVAALEMTPKLFKKLCMTTSSYTAIISSWRAGDPDPVLKETWIWIGQVLAHKNK